MAALPHFLIVGTMKGGTTILYDFINSHHKVDKASQKEIHYFSLYPYLGVEWYQQHFSPQRGNITGEASPTYFDMATSPVIPKSIKALVHDIKIILIVRDPIERAVSHFYHFCRVNKIKSLREDEINAFFETPFLEAYAQTKQENVFLNHILSFSFYFRKYKIFSNVFDKNQLMVMSNTMLKNNPQETMQSVFEFLGLEPFTSKLFNQFKYSSGAKTDVLDQKIFEKLQNLFYPDYRVFCSATGLKFDPIVRG